jgi:hypothetical protein
MNKLAVVLASSIVIAGSPGSEPEHPTFACQEPLRFDAEVSDQAKKYTTGNGNAALVVNPGTHRNLQGLR